MAVINVSIDTENRTIVCDIEGERFEGAKEVRASVFEFMSGGDTKRELDFHISGSIPGMPDGVRKTVVLTNASKAKSELTRGNATLSPDKTIAFVDSSAEEIVEGAFKLFGKQKKNKDKNDRNNKIIY